MATKGKITEGDKQIIRESLMQGKKPPEIADILGGKVTPRTVQYWGNKLGFRCSSTEWALEKVQS